MAGTELEQALDKLPQKIRDMILDKYKGKEQEAAFVAGVVDDMIDTIIESLTEIAKEQNERLGRVEQDVRLIKEHFGIGGDAKTMVEQLEEIREILEQMQGKK